MWRLEKRRGEAIGWIRRVGWRPEDVRWEIAGNPPVMGGEWARVGE